MKLSATDFRKSLFEHYPDEICHLHWDRTRPWTLLWAVILSAQCTDKRVNMTTPELFRQFPNLESYTNQPLKNLETLIRPTGFYHTKARHIRAAAETILLEHNGHVPDTMEALLTLPGVGRKTANVVLWNLYSLNEGFVVDTHVKRIMHRTGFTRHTDPQKIEQDLMKQFPREDWGHMSHMLVQFGRDTCKAPRPRCETCFLRERCPRIGVKHEKKDLL